MKSIFSQSDIDYLKENYDKKQYSEIAIELGYTERQIRSKINNMGLTKLRKFDKNYFQTIDTDEKAYWLGFIYADGCVIFNPEKRNYELSIQLNKNDDYILSKLSRNIGGNHKLKYIHSYKEFNGYKYETDSCVLRVYAKQIVEDLIDIGIVPDKTNKKDFPKCNEYFTAFLRGFLDGDGCIYIQKNKNLIMVNFTNANYEFFNYINNQLKNQMGIVGNIYKEKDKKYRLVVYRKNDVKILLDNIYTDLSYSYLDRKYQIYKSYYGFTV